MDLCNYDPERAHNSWHLGDLAGGIALLCERAFERWRTGGRRRGHINHHWPGALGGRARRARVRGP